MKQPGKVLFTTGQFAVYYARDESPCSNDHMKAVLNNSFQKDTQEIIHDSTKLYDVKNKFIYFNCIFFSVGQMAVSPSFHYYFLHLLVLALQVSFKMEHLQIVCDHIAFENVKKLV